MPSMRVLLVRLFPKLGPTQHSATSYSVSNRHIRTTGNTADSVSNISSTPIQRNKNGIPYSQSFIEEQRNRWERDKTSLVQLDDFDAEASKWRNPASDIEA